MTDIKEESRKVFEQLLEVAKLEKGDIVIIGCSSSEVAGRKIGTFSAEEIGKAIFETLNAVAKQNDIFLAAQCCEHLNRALVIERSAAKLYGYAIVNAVPQLKAGGSFATAAYHGLDDAAVVESIKAAAGIDIGDTLIGMHLSPVAVPVRTAQKTIGEAHVVCARTRAKFVGGSRAVYDEKLL